jgi:hypothetical protein
MSANLFDSEKWLDEKKLELINLMFKNEFSIQDFRNTSKVINFDDLQTEAIRDRINKYRGAMGVLFKADEIRSVLDYYYLQQDKKPVLNLIKQILKYYGYEFSRTSEYQGNYGGKKVYKSRYTIVQSKKDDKNTIEGEGEGEGEIETEGGNEDKIQEILNSQQSKRKVITKLVKTYTIDVDDKN